MVNLTTKQLHYWKNATHRWNFQVGATRSGKTYLTYYLLAKRIRACTGKGLIVMIGNTQTTLERNVLEPMREIYGKELIGNIRNDNTAIIFGKKVHCLGADNKARVEKLQGTTIEYCYGDEVATWSQEVFEMLKSRLSTDTSLFDGTSNPDSPNHWLKKFLDNDKLDIYLEHYTLYDNTFLSSTFIKALELEYEGTIYYDRFILGKWQHAEGVVFEWFANDPEQYYINEDNEMLSKINELTIGLDIGGNNSKTVAVLMGHTYDGRLITLANRTIDHRGGGADPNDIYKMVMELYQYGKRKKFRGICRKIYIDSAEQVIRVGLRRFMNLKGIDVSIENSVKTQFKERELAYIHLLKNGKMYFLREAKQCVDAITTAMRDTKNSDKLLDDGTTDVDTFDAHYYSFSSRANKLIKRGNY